MSDAMDARPSEEAITELALSFDLNLMGILPTLTPLIESLHSLEQQAIIWHVRCAYAFGRADLMREIQEQIDAKEAFIEARVRPN